MPGGKTTVPGLRWWIVGLLFLASLISYIDRLTLSVLAPAICADLKLSNLAYASIGSWFLLTYSAGQALFGRWQDRIGTKLGLTVAICVWSIAEIAHSLARGLASFSAVRLVLGAGEGGHWPAAIKAVAEWFPIQERAIGMGIVNTGATLGSALAPPLIVWLQYRFGWQATFVVTGVVGFVWLALWLALFRQPAAHPLISHGELVHIQGGQSIIGPETTAPSWIDLLNNRAVLSIVLARFLADAIWWLYLIWLPLYLYSARGFSLKKIGILAWIPFVAADAGALLGGWSSGYLIRRGWTPRRARFSAIVFSAVLAPAGMLVARAQSAEAALFFISVVLFSFQFWVNNVQTLPSDLFPTPLIASISGMAGMGAGLGAMLFTLATGWTVDHFGYMPVLVGSGFLLPLATGVLLLLV
jgi:ACS family hexuronate transporter-like MFS transporter